MQTRQIWQINLLLSITITAQMLVNNTKHIIWQCGHDRIVVLSAHQELVPLYFHKVEEIHVGWIVVQQFGEFVNDGGTVWRIHVAAQDIMIETTLHKDIGSGNVCELFSRLSCNSNRQECGVIGRQGKSHRWLWWW